MKKKIVIGMVGACLMGIPAVYAGVPADSPMPVRQMQQPIKGTVTDGHEPLVGATVVVTGTTNGTVVDIDGNFNQLCGLQDHDGRSVQRHESRPRIRRRGT